MTILTEKEKEIYARQILLWGNENQEKLKRAKVGIIGTGGLGSPILIYLTVAGIGKIIVADKDRVELNNLNRQILHWSRDVGRAKVESAEEKLRQINPDVELICYDAEVTSRNIGVIFKDVDALIDGLDNFPSRFLMNEYAWKRKIPFFHGAVWGLEGRLATFIPGKTGCLRCLYEEAPPEETFPVVGVTPALIAILQTTEVLKYFTGVGELFLNRMLIYDGLKLEFKTIPLRKNPKCPVCGKDSQYS